MSEAEQRSLRALHPVLERVRPALDAAVEAAAAQIPVFAKLLETMDPATREAQAAVSRALERAALLDGEWEPYAASLRAHGMAYAQMGVAFEDWYALLRPFRDLVEAELLPSAGRLEREALVGLHLFLDRTMVALANAYIETKQQLVVAAEAQLSLYAQLFHESPIGKVIYEWEAPPDLTSFRLVASNERAMELSGGTLQDRVGRTLGEGAAYVMATELPARLASALTDGEPQRWTAHRATESGELIFDCQCFAMGARTVGLLFEDVTERRRTAEALAQRARELERSNKELDDFAYVASHDLKAPLRDIDSLATWIEEDASEVLPEESGRHLATIRDRIGRMERLLDDLLRYSRAGRVFHQAEAFEIRAVIDEVLSVAAPPDGFELVVTGDAPQLRAPRVPLELALRNLVQNAIKHHHGDRGRIEIAVAEEADRVSIAVSDDGPGIAPEFHERIFRMFQTLRPRDEVEGSGMGLAVVKKVVEAHGGVITVESALGSGTTFRFTWPREWRRPER
jgi:signal transduction histidine kinase